MAEENTSEGQPVPKTGLLTFFLAHQIGRYTVAKMLRAPGPRVEVHLDHFPGNTPDHEWIPEVGRRGWVLITKDQHIHRNPLERESYVAAKLRRFIVTGKDMNGNELRDLLVRCLDGMVRRTARRTGPLLFTISRAGLFRKLNLSGCEALLAADKPASLAGKP